MFTLPISLCLYLNKSHNAEWSTSCAETKVQSAKPATKCAIYKSQQPGILRTIIEWCTWPLQSKAHRCRKCHAAWWRPASLSAQFHIHSRVRWVKLPLTKLSTLCVQFAKEEPLYKTIYVLTMARLFQRSVLLEVVVLGKYLETVRGHTIQQWSGTGAVHALRCKYSMGECQPRIKIEQVSSIDS